MTPRWIIKRILRLLPQKRRYVLEPPWIKTVIYIFSGTWGDFVQCLRTFESIRREYPEAELLVSAPRDMIRAFGPFLPPGLKRLSRLSLAGLAFQPAVLLLTNVITVYRVRWELAAYFCSTWAYGFCYGREEGRRSFHCCIRLDGSEKNYTHCNRRLLELHGREPLGTWALMPGDDGMLERPAAAMRLDVSVPVLFHVGSAGFMNAMGPDRFSLAAGEIIGFLQKQGYTVQVAAADADRPVLKKMIQKYPDIETHVHSAEALGLHLNQFQGTILCFDSFMAHFCYYLGKSAVVLHQNRVPPGYDCSPLHTQIVLKKEDDWDLTPLFSLFSPF